MPIDLFESNKSQITAPATRHYAVVPSNIVDLPFRPRVLVCVGDGDAVVRDEADTDITYSLIAGDRLEFRAMRVLATGTTATLVAWY